MNPTPKLRFVERDSYYKNGEAFMFPHKIRVLQQWWVDITGDWITATEFKPHGEWRDVTLETEND